MLETKEMKFIITTEDGKMIAGYNNLKFAETDAEDFSTEKKNKKFHIYEMTNSVNITDGVLQKTYNLKTTYPLPEPEPEPEKEPEKEDKKDEEKTTGEESKKDEEKKD
jgi:hypothetical protein